MTRSTTLPPSHKPSQSHSLASGSNDNRTAPPAKHISNCLLCFVLTAGLMGFAASHCFAATSIDTVYFAQTHVLKPDNPHFGLVSNRPALIKAHVVDPTTPAAPEVTALLALNGQTLNLPLTGPGTLPASIPDGPGVVQHSYNDTFTASIPAAWVKPGLVVTVQAGAASVNFPNLKIGAPTTVILTMFDIGFFGPPSNDYPDGWEEEIESKWPVADLRVRRAPGVAFRELVIQPREGVKAVRVTSTTDYLQKTGIPFDGEQAATSNWNHALRRAAGGQRRISLYYSNIHNVSAGGQASPFAGVGDGGNTGILLHELGHALSLPHWGETTTYPYKGAMHGIQPPDTLNGTHAGPAWAFDLRSGTFIPPTVQANNAGSHTAGTYKADPMQGGGSGWQEQGYLFNHFSDYSVNQMRDFLESHVVVWNETLGTYASWNQIDGGFTTIAGGVNDVTYPVVRDSQVISVMASVSAATPEACLVYPPIGPYTAGMTRLFDPRNTNDQVSAQNILAPANGCDVSLRLIQGGVEKIYMLPVSWLPESNPLDAGSLFTEAINLPAADGAVTKVELILTPNAEVNGLPANPQVLYSWIPLAPDPMTFATPPQSISSTAIEMMATKGSLNLGTTAPIEYYFTETSGNPGGSDSGWQTSPSYIDSGLLPNLTYRYTVRMRAGSLEVDASAPASATTIGATALDKVSLMSTQTFALQSGSGLKAVTNLGAFDANGSDKLVVVISTEHSFNNGLGYVNRVTYNGIDLLQAVQEDAGVNRGTAAIFYLDHPGPIGAGTIEVDCANANGGLGAAYALKGTRPGVAATNTLAGNAVTTLPITAMGKDSLLIAVLNNSGNNSNAGVPTLALPFTQVSSGSWGSSWGGHASGYLKTTGPGYYAAHFTTNTGTGYSISIAAAEFLPSISADYVAWAAAYPSPAREGLADPAADYDGDGLTNEKERLFGTDPSLASSTNPITGPFVAATGTFNYTRRDDALSGLTYSIWVSDTMNADSWLQDSGATQVPGPVNAAGTETVAVTLSPALLTNSRLFARVLVK